MSFTNWEKEFIELICRQFSNKQFARKLNPGIHTTEDYREKIEYQMNANSTAGRVNYAVKKGLFIP